MRAKIRLAVAAAVAIFGVGVAFFAKPASAFHPCVKHDCYAVTVDYEGQGPAICCDYTCDSGDQWVCIPGQ
jgi:hypothetical protein